MTVSSVDSAYMIHYGIVDNTMITMTTSSMKCCCINASQIQRGFPLTVCAIQIYLLTYLNTEKH